MCWPSSHQWLRDIAINKLRDPVGFWQKMEALSPVKGAVPKSARAALDHLMPEPGLAYSLRRRVSGLGSLGHPRFVALADWQGGKIAREAKALVPSLQRGREERFKGSRRSSINQC